MEQCSVFRKKVSQGSRFNQIYIPKAMESVFGVGDEVEVRLIKKHFHLFYSHHLKKLSPFKEDLIKKIFAFFQLFSLPVFVVGSFVTQKAYRDLDLAILVKERDEKYENQLAQKLTEEINLNFHLLFIPQDKFEYLLKACPLTRVMFSHFVSNQQFNLKFKKVIDKNHLNFLLMMPQDLLEIDADSRVFFDNLRRLITIKKFLENHDLTIDKIDYHLENVLGKLLFEKIKNNEAVDKKTLDDLRKIIREKLKKIKKLIPHG